MSGWSYCLLLANIFLVTVTANLGHIRTLDAQQDERIRLECTVTSKLDAEEAMWMRIRPPHNPDILTYRDSVVYAPDRIHLEQRRLSSSTNANGTLIDTYFLTLTIQRPNIDDEGRYLCSRGKIIFAEYDLFIIVPPQFADDNSFIQQRTVIEGSTLQLSCSAHGRPKPSITWFSRTADGKHLALEDGAACQETVCELRLGNYTRHDPTTIECVADNSKSTRISKVFHVDVYYSPKVITNLRTFTGSRSIDILLECSSISNPPGSIIWLDDQREEIHPDQQPYTIKVTNQSSALSFSVSSQGHSTFTYYCRSNNSIGVDEKLIDVSELIQLDSITIRETTSVTVPPSLSTTQNLSTSKRLKTVRPNRARSRHSSTVALLTSTTIDTSNSCTPASSNNLLFLIVPFLIICFV